MSASCVRTCRDIAPSGCAPERAGPGRSIPNAPRGLALDDGRPQFTPRAAIPCGKPQPGFLGTPRALPSPCCCISASAAGFMTGENPPVPPTPSGMAGLMPGENPPVPPTPSGTAESGRLLDGVACWGNPPENPPGLRGALEAEPGGVACWGNPGPGVPADGSASEGDAEAPGVQSLLHADDVVAVNADAGRPEPARPCKT
jgi:hypothetical protein